MVFDFDTADPHFQANPYPYYERLRRETPVGLRVTDRGRCWWLTRHEDITEMLADPRFSAQKMAPLLANMDPEAMPPALRLVKHVMLVVDPPRHTRLRGLVSSAFSPRVVERLRPRVHQIAEQLLDANTRGSSIELMEALAAPISVKVIAELLGLPPEDSSQLKKWSDEIAPLLDDTLLRGTRFATLAAAAGALYEYISGIVRDRRAHPADDLISRMLQAQDDDDVLSEDEIIATALIVLGAGNETTTNLIGNGVNALLRHPEQLALLRREPDRIPAAIEEMLRFDSPVQVAGRIALEDIEFHGEKVRKGDELNAVFAAGNRDPEAFANPDTFDITRSGTRHLAFGHGVHFCLGAQLARLEGEVVLETLLTRYSHIELGSVEARWRPGFVLRGLSELPLRIRTA